MSELVSLFIYRIPLDALQERSQGTQALILGIAISDGTDRKTDSVQLVRSDSDAPQIQLSADIVCVYKYHLRTTLVCMIFSRKAV